LIAAIQPYLVGCLVGSAWMAAASRSAAVGFGGNALSDLTAPETASANFPDPRLARFDG
jgi:hypothetical protein